VAKWCVARKAALLVGTTGHDAAMSAAWDDAARHVPVLVAPNTSVGITALLAHLGPLAEALAGFDAHIVEAHHRAKADAPSGTALALRRAIGADVPTSSIRAGTVPGVHTVHLAGPHERIEITHVAESRECFVSGALRAAAWLAARPAGRYTMRDVIAANVKETA
jgi:4-hydroxy-tetrahydrodipicolinate reductase